MSKYFGIFLLRRICQLRNNLYLSYFHKCNKTYVTKKTEELSMKIIFAFTIYIFLIKSKIFGENLEGFPKTKSAKFWKSIFLQCYRDTFGM